MADEGKQQEFLDKVGPERRDFLKLVLAGGAFAAPLVASFSIDEMSLAVPEAHAQYGPYCSNMTFQTDPGYAGPRRFAAYVWSPSTRVNGLIKLVYEDERRRDVLRTSLKLSRGSSVSGAWIEVDGQNVATVDVPKDKIRDDALMCLPDLAALVEALASERAVFFVQGTHATHGFFTLSGVIHPEVW